MAAQNEQERQRLGTQIARSRKLRGRNWTQADLAQRAGIGSRRTITSVERGGKADEQTLRKIEVAFGWPEGTADEVARGFRPNPDEGYEGVDPEPNESTRANTVVTTVSFGAVTADEIQNMSTEGWTQFVKDGMRVIYDMEHYRLISRDDVEKTKQRLINAARLRNPQQAEWLKQMLS